jgi:hypothetical protein
VESKLEWMEGKGLSHFTKVVELLPCHRRSELSLAKLS